MRNKYILDKVSNFDSDYIEQCLKALARINPFDIICCSDDEIAKVYERNFIINMAYQLGVDAEKYRLYKDTNSFENMPRLISGEIKKQIYSNASIGKFYEKLQGKKYSADKLCVFPDFIIHESNDMDCSSSGQHLIIEAKSSSILKIKDFGWDLFKLNLYVSNLGFRNAIYLIIGQKIEDLQILLDQYVQLEYSWIVGPEDLKKIFFIVKEKVTDSPIVYQLKEIRCL